MSAKIKLTAWLKANLGPRALAPLCGGELHVLEACGNIAEAMAYEWGDRARIWAACGLDPLSPAVLGVCKYDAEGRGE